MSRGNEAVVLRRLDDQRELHGGRLHFDRRPGVRIHRAIDDVGPVHQIGHGAGIKAEALFGDGGDETGAGLEIGIVKLAIALVLLEVGRILGREKGALMMVEPPGNFGRTGVLEVHDGVFVAIKLLLIEQRPGAVQQAGENEGDIVSDPLPVKAREEGGRRCPVKAFVVIEDPNFQSFPSQVLLSAPVASRRGCEPKANRNDIPKKICQARKFEPVSGKAAAETGNSRRAPAKYSAGRAN